MSVSAVRWYRATLAALARGEHLAAVPQPQYRAPPLVEDRHPQHRVGGGVAVRAGGVELGLEQRIGSAELAPQVVDREVRVGPYVRLDSPDIQQHRAP